MSVDKLFNLGLRLHGRDELFGLIVGITIYLIGFVFLIKIIRGAKDD